MVTLNELLDNDDAKRTLSSIDSIRRIEQGMRRSFMDEFQSALGFEGTEEITRNENRQDARLKIFLIVNVRFFASFILLIFFVFYFFHVTYLHAFQNCLSSLPIVFDIALTTEKQELNFVVLLYSSVPFLFVQPQQLRIQSNVLCVAKLQVGLCGICQQGHSMS